MQNMNDYIEGAQRTKSTQFHGDKVGFNYLEELSCELYGECQFWDTIKRALFYGKLPEGQGDQQMIVDGTPLNELFTTSQEQDILHGAIGLITEAGELMEGIYNTKVLNQPLDMINVKEELGDIMWYMAIILKATGSSFEEIAAKNLAKLQHRFPDKFTQDKALNRDLDGERKVLEA